MNPVRFEDHECKVDGCHSLMIAACLPLRLHQIRENIVNQRQMAAALRFQPDNHVFIQTNADCPLPRSDVAESNHSCKLSIGQTRDAFEIDSRVVPGRLVCGNPLKGTTFSISQWKGRPNLLLISSDFTLFSGLNLRAEMMRMVSSPLYSSR